MRREWRIRKAKAITNFPFVPTLKVVTTSGRFRILQKEFRLRGSRSEHPLIFSADTVVPTIDSHQNRIRLISLSVMICIYIFITLEAICPLELLRVFLNVF